MATIQVVPRITNLVLNKRNNKLQPINNVSACFQGLHIRQCDSEDTGGSRAANIRGGGEEDSLAYKYTYIYTHLQDLTIQHKSSCETAIWIAIGV